MNELLGTKLRALYQRKKGRDLFDLYYADQNSKLDYDAIITSYNKYVSFSVDTLPTQIQFIQNIKAKEKDAGFKGDMEGLLRAGIEYDQGKAFEWLKGEIIERI